MKVDCVLRFVYGLLAVAVTVAWLYFGWQLWSRHKPAPKPELAIEEPPPRRYEFFTTVQEPPVPGTVTLSDRFTAVGTTTTWLGSPLVSTDKLQTITSKDAVQIGLRSDGVVVWRKAEGEGK